MKKSRTVIFLFFCLFLRDTNGSNNVEEHENSRLDIEEPSYNTTEGAREPLVVPRTTYEEESEPEEGPTGTATLPNTSPNSTTTTNVIIEDSEGNNLARDDIGVEKNEILPEDFPPQNNISTDPPVPTTTDENLDLPTPLVDPLITNTITEEIKDETTKGAFLDFLEKKEPEVEVEKNVTTTKKEVETFELQYLSDLISDTESSDEYDRDLGSDIEHLRSILSSLQQVLLFVAAGTFSFIVLYTAFYINILRKIYSRTTCSKKKNK